jgi:hypothetical protein
MTNSRYRIVFALLVCLAAAMPAFASKGLRSKRNPAAPRKDGKNEKVTLEIAGPTDSQSAAAFQKAFTASGLPATIHENKKGGKALKIMSKIDKSTDLAPYAKVVSAVIPARRGTTPPALELVLYAPVTKDNQRQVVSELEKVKGVDAKNSTVDPKKGALRVRVSGAESVTADDISKAVQSAGVAGHFAKRVKTKTKKT